MRIISIDTAENALSSLNSMRVKSIFALLAIIAMGVGMTACDQVDLDDPQPETSVSLDQAVNSTSGFASLINSGYDRLQSGAFYGQQWVLYPEALADNAQLAERGGNRYPNVINNVPRTHMVGWGAMYSTINEMNVILQNIDGFTPTADNPEALKDQIRGQALFLRGLAYFDLLRIYSYMPGTIDGRNREPGDFSLGVPLTLEPTLSTEDAESLPRSQNTEVYDQVISDFESAGSLLEENSAGPGSIQGGPARATAAASAGMLSRVHLYLTNWEQAETAATRAINLTNATVVDSRDGGFEDAWRASSYPGSVFELSMTSGQDATGADGLQDLTFFTDPNNDGTPNNFAYQLVTSDDVRSIYTSDDARQSLFATDPDGSVYIEKYNGTIAQFADRIPLLRMAELRLNRAEARAQQGKTNDAQTDLNYIRERRGLNSASSTGQALVDEILEERRREFLFEGKRFFTLKRYARDIPKPQVGPSVSVDFDGPLSERRLILSNIPDAIIQSNGGLVQNPGY
ncbi:RagB/SusD family nutrient uptake outer membrane protein [Salinibacter altiplanensis]|uniref:RagB/SusD family nutrient uptake outer membrane protein n=1 Tax=Salinibacter altiplanensis TaxID=1803181 RepID=UPI000C9FCF01|nr:RagB/SusD family nutrient uptake outer membrane protein [Salinibacter altiplanensis]